MMPEIQILFAKESCVFMKFNIGRGSFFFLLKMIHCVLMGEKLKPVSEDHLLRESSTCWRKRLVVIICDPLQYMLQSSAKRINLTGLSRFLHMSFIATRKSVTLSTDPCGSPFSMVCGDEIFVSILFFHTVSYAFVISKAIVMRCWIRLNAEQISVCNEDNASIVEWFFLKPHCSLANSLDNSKVHISRLFIIFSISLLSVLIKDISL